MHFIGIHHLNILLMVNNMHYNYIWYIKILMVQLLLPEYCFKLIIHIKLKIFLIRLILYKVKEILLIFHLILQQNHIIIIKDH
jgi:hypothetical protein